MRPSILVMVLEGLTLAFFMVACLVLWCLLEAL